MIDRSILTSPKVDSEIMAEALVGCEWLPPSTTGGPRPPSPARTEEDQDGLDELTDRMSELDLNNATGASNDVTPYADGLAQEEGNSGFAPTHDAPRDSALTHNEDVNTNLVIDTPAATDPVKHEDTNDVPETNDTPKTTDAETQTEDLIDSLPTFDAANTNDSAEENVTDSQLSGETVVARGSVQEEGRVDLIPKDDPPKPKPGSVTMEQKITWQVNKGVLETTKASFSVVVQVEIRAAH